MKVRTGDYNLCYSTTSPYIDVIAILEESVFITSTSIYHLLQLSTSMETLDVIQHKASIFQSILIQW